MHICTYFGQIYVLHNFCNIFTHFLMCKMDCCRKILAIMFALLVCLSNLTAAYAPCINSDNGNGSISNTSISELIQESSHFKYFRADSSTTAIVFAKLQPRLVVYKLFSFCCIGLPIVEHTIVSTQRDYLSAELLIFFRASIKNLIYPFNYFW